MLYRDSEPALAIGVESIEIDADENSPIIQCSIVLDSPQNYSLFPRDTPITVDFCGTIYHFVVEQRRFERNPVEEATGPEGVQATVTALSPVALLSSTRHERVTLEQTTPIMARDLVETLLGQAVSWQAEDWLIQGYRFAVEDVSPLEAAMRIIDEPNYIMQSIPDGRLLVRPKHIVDIPNYDTATVPTEIFGDRLYEINEQASLAELWNKVTIRDDNGETSDEFEFILDPLDPLHGWVDVYPVPWRTTVFVRSTHSGVAVFGGAIQNHSISKEEVFFEKGVGRLRYPPLTVGLVDWETDNLGFLTVVGRELRTSAGDGYSKAFVSYVTQRIRFPVRSNDYRTALVKIMDLV